MSATPDQSRLERIEELGKTLLRASEALEAECWHECELLCYRAARESRMLLLADKQEEKDRKYREGS